LVSHTKGRIWIEDVKKKVLKRIFGPKREEVAGCWKRLHNEEVHKVCI
jgi:hypothetical protein